MAKTKLSLRKALQNKSMEQVTEVVTAAVSVYASALPAVEPEIETAFGSTPVSMLLDKKSKLLAATAEYTVIANAVKQLPEEADRKVEIAKLIASSATLRYLTGEGKEDESLL